MTGKKTERRAGGATSSGHPEVEIPILVRLLFPVPWTSVADTLLTVPRLFGFVPTRLGDWLRDLFDPRM